MNKNVNVFIKIEENINTIIVKQTHMPSNLE